MPRLIYIDCKRLCFVRHPSQIYPLTPREIFCLLLELAPTEAESISPVVKLSLRTITFYLRNVQVKGGYVSQKKMLTHFKRLLRRGDLKLPHLLEFANRQLHPKVISSQGATS